MELVPIAERVLIKPDKEEEVVQGGILLPQQHKESSTTGRVIAVGPGVKQAKPGDVVLMPQVGGVKVKLNGHDHRVLRENDLVGILS